MCFKEEPDPILSGCAAVKDGAEMNLRERNNQASPSKMAKSIISCCRNLDMTVLGQMAFPISLELHSNQTNINMAGTNRPRSNEEKSLYVITTASWKRLDLDSFEENSNKDTLQLLSWSLRAHCAFSALTLVVPHLLPPGSSAILLMAEFPPPTHIHTQTTQHTLPQHY